MKRNLKFVVSFGNVLALLAMLLMSEPAWTAPTTKTAGVAAISTGTGLGFAASGVGAPVAAFIGGFEIGWGIGCVLFDPPDTANAGLPVSLSTYSVFHLPDAQTIFPTAPASLANGL